MHMLKTVVIVFLVLGLLAAAATLALRPRPGAAEQGLLPLRSSSRFC